MWLERLKLFFKTSIWRFTLAFTLIVLLICSGMLFVVYQFTLGEQNKQLEDNIAVAVAGFTDLANASQMNQSGFKQAVVERTKRTTSLVLSLQTVDETVGNLDGFQATINRFPDFQRFPVMVTDHLGEPTIKLVVATRVSTRFGTLTLGMFDENQALQHAFITVASITLTGALVITLFAGLVFNRRVLLRLKDIADLTAKVKAGHLHTRLPISDRSNEYDVIAGQINQMLDEIDELIHSVASVTDNIAHDLRTPLSRIRIGIDSFKQGESLDENTQRWREQLLSELDQVMDTFEAMLELSRLEKGVQSTERTLCQLESICEDAVALAEPLAEEKNQQLCFNMVHPQTIEGDANLLFRMLFNLLENAIKYADEGAKISLVLKENSLLVMDNGPGIAAIERDRVFQRLYRLDQSRSGKGFGLGLSIVKAIVELHDGNICLDDNNPGLRVTVTFPLL